MIELFFSQHHGYMSRNKDLLTPHFHMINLSLLWYTLLVLAFAKTYIVSAREEAFLTCTYNLYALG